MRRMTSRTIRSFIRSVINFIGAPRMVSKVTEWRRSYTAKEAYGVKGFTNVICGYERSVKLCHEYRPPLDKTPCIQKQHLCSDACKAQGIIGFNGHIQCADEKLENADAETSSKNDISTRRPLHWSDEAASQEVGSAEQDVVTAVSGCNTKIHDCVLDEQDTITIDWPKSVTNAVHPWHPLLSTDLNTDELWFLNGYTSSPDPLSLLTHACDDEAEQSWEQFLNHFCVASFKKIGEGTFSEVYETLSLDLSKVVLKVTPVEDCTAGGLKAKTFGSILPEVLIYKQIQTLAEGDRFSTPCFIGAEKVHLIRGKCPRLLTQAWNEFASKRSYYSVCPESFSERQHFIIVETSYGGVNLESFKFRRFAQAISVFVQITLSLAIAERVFFFEHRDLHVGNILIQAVPTQTPVQFVYRGQTMFVRSHGVKASIIDFSLSRINKGRAVIRTDLAADEDLFSGVGDYQFEIYRMMKQENGFVYRGQTMFVRSHGVKASIIDFSLSRINKGRAVIRTDLAADEDLFSGVGDYQFEIYRMMKQENGIAAKANNWSKFTPRSNVFWLHYLLRHLMLRHLCERTQYPINSRPSRKRLRYMQEIIFPAVLSSGSATEVLEHQQLLELFAKEIDMWSE
ncbi:Serine/threonine-protein kinase haspin [Toxocara canis]|uniref:non-specific serine/threonine protein kinase n=1 Tax=Toxocara canis TaxID=6265 RepID=A0A0B2VHR2_TOXCA|nr:Serine/threonine-protein kinase haspin [Toxocara canis]